MFDFGQYGCQSQQWVLLYIAWRRQNTRDGWILFPLISKHSCLSLTTSFYSAACYIVLGQPKEALEEARLATQLEVTVMAILQWPQWWECTLLCYTSTVSGWQFCIFLPARASQGLDKAGQGSSDVGTGGRGAFPRFYYFNLSSWICVSSAVIENRNRNAVSWRNRSEEWRKSLMSLVYKKSGKRWPILVFFITLVICMIFPAFTFRRIAYEKIHTTEVRSPR